MPRHLCTRKKKRTAKHYTTGELNEVIDSLCHPLFKTNEGFILVDGLLHGIVEQNPQITIRKFIKYNLPKLIEQIEKKTKEKQSSEHSWKRINKRLFGASFHGEHHQVPGMGKTFLSITNFKDGLLIRTDHENYAITPNNPSESKEAIANRRASSTTLYFRLRF